MSDDRDFSAWLKLYKNDFFNFWKTYMFLKNKDKYYLTNQKIMDFEDENYEFNYENGFIEKDFQYIASSENPKDKRVKNKIILYIVSGIDLSKIKNNLSEEFFYQIIEDSLVHGDYEKYGISFEKVIGILISKKYIERDCLFEISILRGTVLASRDYSSMNKLMMKMLKILW